MSNINVPHRAVNQANVTNVGEPSDAAWRRFGSLAAESLARLAERDALAADRIERVAS